MSQSFDNLHKPVFMAHHCLILENVQCELEYSSLLAVLSKWFVSLWICSLVVLAIPAREMLKYSTKTRFVCFSHHYADFYYFFSNLVICVTFKIVLSS